MNYLDEQEIQQVREKADIVDVISHYMPIESSGRNKKCQCPFHDDHDPSLTISQEKQIFKCFVCGAGGNVFTFVQKFEQISFIEAVYKVAQLANVSLSKELDTTSINVNPYHLELYKVLQAMIEFTHYQLSTNEGKQVKDYLYQRQINDAIIDRFEIGFDSGKEAVYHFLSAKKLKEEHMIAAGVVRMSEYGFQDVFAKRITIPIHDIQGHPIGFTARALVGSEEAKYINTSATEIYQKGNILFNYHRAKQIVKQLKCLYVVEGAMDVIAFEKAGIQNVVATLGTSCTKEQVQLLKKLHVNIVLCYDGDKAGKNATYKLGKLLQQQVPLAIVDNPYDLDPDEIIQEYGAANFIALSQKTIGWIPYLFQYLRSKYNLDNYSEKKDFAKELASEIAMIKDTFERQSYYRQLQEITGFDMNLQMGYNSPTKWNRKQSLYVNSVEYPKSGRMLAQFQILGQMFCSRSAVQYFCDELGFLPDENCHQLAMYIIEYYRMHDTLSFAQLYDKIQEQPVQDLLLDIASWELAPKEAMIEVLKDAIIKVKCCLLDEQIEKAKQEVITCIDPLLKAALMDKRNELIRKRNELLSKK